MEGVNTSLQEDTMKFLFSVLLFPSLVFAQGVVIEKPVVCINTKSMIEILSKGEFKEKPVWIGKDESSNYSVFANEKTKTWTIIQFNKEIACVLGTGDSFQNLTFAPDT